MSNDDSSRSRGDSIEFSFSETDDEGQSSKPNWVEHEVLQGFDEKGDVFVVPPTRDTVGMLKRINELPTLVTWFFIALTVYIGLPQQWLGFPVLDYFGVEAYPRHYLIYVVVFWRLMYNVFLGVVLSYQSRTKGLTNYVREVHANKTSFMYKLLSFLLRATVGCESMEEKPPEFNAWVLNTQVVNVILPNDVFAFSFFALRELNLFGYTSEGDMTLTLLFQSVIPNLNSPLLVVNKELALIFHVVVYIVGMVLIIFSLWGKFLSHKVIGYYAWFWGDFFFRIDKTLKFDGIFEVFPHPMYTVGYAWMYGTSMICGSYQVLALTMFSHISQMAFLAWCEEPHIQRTYGVEFEKTKSTHSENILIIRNFDFYRASDWMMAIILTLYVMTTIICGGVLGREPLIDEYYFLANALLTTLICKTTLSWMLYKQGKTRFWTSHFLKQGQTREQSFDEWKRIQNLLENVTNISFWMLAWRVFQWPSFQDVLDNQWSYLCGSFFVFMLFGISYWSFTESYDALGDFGWFHGDFFLRASSSDITESSGEGYVARGIYRYFSHPTIIFGKFWLYALTILCNDADVTAIAVLHHALSFLQTIVVEEPHMQRIYQRRIRHSGVMQTLTKLEIIDNKKKKKQ